MKATIDIDGNDVVIWLNYNGKVIHTAYEIALDELGYSRDSGEFDDFVEAQLEAGGMTDEEAEALTGMETAIAEAVYRSLEEV